MRRAACADDMPGWLLPNHFAAAILESFREAEREKARARHARRHRET